MSATKSLGKEICLQTHAGVKDNVVPALCAAVLGLALILAAGFAETHALHNAAHDARHSAGFPCH